MMKTKHTAVRLSLVVGLLVAGLSASAQNLIARTTDMNWSSIYGGGPTVLTPSDSFSSSVLEASSTNTMGFHDAQTGTFPLDWTAQVDLDIAQSFNVAGPLSNFTSIAASMDGSKFQAATGIGSAGIQSSLPGNSLLFEFTVADSLDYDLSGSFAFTPNLSFVYAFLTMSAESGGNWGTFYDTRQQGLGNAGSFSKTGTLGAGSYRIFIQTELSLGLTPATTHIDYTFRDANAVPEPASLTLLVGACALIRRKRSR